MPVLPKKPAYHEMFSLWKSLMDAGLVEDGAQWDWTSMGLGNSGRMKARVVAKSEGIWASTGLVEHLNTRGVLAKCTIRDGAALRRGQIVARIDGPARLVLALERPFLNLAAYSGGIATATRRLVTIVRHECPRRPPRVTATRKTLPYYRDLAIHAVIVGGGHSHRVSLSGGVLIKENHIATAGGIGKAVEGVRGIAPHGLRVEVEVRSKRELAQALACGVDGVLLDNFTPIEIHAALKVCARAAVRPLIEVSGGIHEGNIGDYAIEGVDVISTGAITHSVRALDLSLLAEG